MFAFFNIGAQELIILFLAGVFYIGVPILVLVVVLTLIRKTTKRGVTEGNTELLSEVQRLREEINHLKNEVIQQGEWQDPQRSRNAE